MRAITVQQSRTASVPARRDAVTLLDGPSLARSLGRPEKTLRQWAIDGVITRHGYDKRGRTLFDVDDVIEVSEHRQRRRRQAHAEEGSDDG